MPKHELSKNYKIKVADAKISVAIDDSFTTSNKYGGSGAPEAKYFHYHAVHELFLCLDKPTTVCTEGGSIEYRNTIIIIPPFFEHFSMRGDAYRILFSIESSGRSDFSRFLSTLCSSDAILSVLAPDISVTYFEELKGALYSENPHADEAAELLLKIFFHKLYDTSPNPKKMQKRISNSNYLTKIDDIIFNFEEDVTLESAARALGLSAKQASRVIKKHYNAPLSRLVTERRLEAACRLLASTDMSISEIAEYVNFHSDGYFFNCFKREYGTTPRKYRESMKGTKKELY